MNLQKSTPKTLNPQTPKPKTLNPKPQNPKPQNPLILSYARGEKSLVLILEAPAVPRAQYPLIKGYTLNPNIKAPIILGILP